MQIGRVHISDVLRGSGWGIDSDRRGVDQRFLWGIEIPNPNHDYIGFIHRLIQLHRRAQGFKSAPANTGQRHPAEIAREGCFGCVEIAMRVEPRNPKI